MGWLQYGRAFMTRFKQDGHWSELQAIWTKSMFAGLMFGVVGRCMIHMACAWAIRYGMPTAMVMSVVAGIVVGFAVYARFRAHQKYRVRYDWYGRFLCICCVACDVFWTVLGCAAMHWALASLDL